MAASENTSAIDDNSFDKSSNDSNDLDEDIPF